MNKTLILKSAERGITLIQRRDAANMARVAIETELATFPHLGNLQGMMMMSAIEAAANITMGMDVEIDLTPEHCKAMEGFYRVYQSAHAVHAMIKIGIEQHVAAGDTTTKVLEG